MNKGSNKGSKLALEGDALKHPASAKKWKAIKATEQEIQIWDLLSRGRNRNQVAEDLDISPNTVTLRINQALEKIRGWSGRKAEDWANQQLLMLNDQISKIVDDTNVEPEPMEDENGEQIFSKAGYPLWIVTPESAAKVRNMARITLQKYLKHQADLLGLLVHKQEVSVEQKVVIGVYNFGDEASLDDL